MNKSKFKEMPNIEKIRVLSGMVMISNNHEEDVGNLTSILALICLISRVEMGDADQDFLDAQIDRLL